MDTTATMGSLHVLNQTGTRATLRFRCDGWPAWSTWLETGGSVRVPAPVHDAIDASATYVDRATGVGYTTPCGVGAVPAGLLAVLRCSADGVAFQLERQPFDRSGMLELTNLTAAEVHIALAFRGTPFQLKVLLAAQARRAIEIGSMNLSVTVDGISTAPLRIAQWTGDIAIRHVDVDGQWLPALVPGRGRGSASPA